MYTYVHSSLRLRTLKERDKFSAAPDPRSRNREIGGVDRSRFLSLSGELSTDKGKPSKFRKVLLNELLLLCEIEDVFALER